MLVIHFAPKGSWTPVSEDDMDVDESPQPCYSPASYLIGAVTPFSLAEPRSPQAGPSGCPTRVAGKTPTTTLPPSEDGSTVTYASDLSLHGNFYVILVVKRTMVRGYLAQGNSRRLIIFLVVVIKPSKHNLHIGT